MRPSHHRHHYDGSGNAAPPNQPNVSVRGSSAKFTTKFHSYGGEAADLAQFRYLPDGGSWIESATYTAPVINTRDVRSITPQSANYDVQLRFRRAADEIWSPWSVTQTVELDTELTEPTWDKQIISGSHYWRVTETECWYVTAWELYARADGIPEFLLNSGLTYTPPNVVLINTDDLEEGIEYELGLRLFDWDRQLWTQLAWPGIFIQV